MGFHFIDIIIVVGIALAIFGPKTLQSIARSTGKGLGQAKTVKDKVMAELPMEEISKMTGQIPQVPLNSRQAIQMLITPEISAKATETKAETKTEAKIVESTVAEPPEKMSS